MFADLNSVFQSYLKIFISVPVVIFILVLYFLLAFKPEVRVYLKNMKIRAGGVEVSSESQIETDKVVEKVARREKKPTAKERKLAKDLEDLSSKLGEKSKDVKNKDEFIDFLVKRLTEYENAYLNLLLVPKTKAALKSISQGFTKAQLAEILQNAGDDSAEIQSVFQVLASNGLTEEQMGQLKITSKGQNFLASINL